MSALSQPRRSSHHAPSQRANSASRRLRVVEEPSRRRRPKLVYGVVALAGALTIGAAQMALSILTTQSSYELSTLSQEARELTWQKQILYDDVAGLSSPQYLAANASALGMVIDESPSYLRLSDGALLGRGPGGAGLIVDRRHRPRLGTQRAHQRHSARDRTEGDHPGRAGRGRRRRDGRRSREHSAAAHRRTAHPEHTLMT